MCVIMVPLCNKSVSPVVMSGDVSDKPADGDTLSSPFSNPWLTYMLSLILPIELMDTYIFVFPLIN